MAGIQEYIRWRGDITYDISPFNEVDYYVLSKIGSPNFTGIVPSDENTADLRSSVGRLFGDDPDSVVLGILASKSILKVLRILPDTPRYSSVLLSGYRAVFNECDTEQFSALTLLLPDGSCLVSFRGTDDNLIAWKEDLQMGVKDAVPAQIDAAEYLQWAVSAYSGPIIVAGHSKGGNLAVYAAAMLSTVQQERIKSVYSFDGPGFKPDFLEQEGYSSVMDRIHDIVPETSIIGTILEKKTNPEIVRCVYSGIQSHDGYRWETSPAGFVRAKELTETSRALNEAMDKIIEEMSYEDAKELIDELFRILTDTGAKTVTDLADINLIGNFRLAKNLFREGQIRGLGGKLIENMIKCLIR